MEKYSIALIIDKNFDPQTGGVERSTSKLAKIFSSHGHKVIIISISNSGFDTVWEDIPIYYTGKKENQKDNLTNILNRNFVKVVINQMGKDVKLTNLIYESISSDVRLINTMRIDPIHFVANHKDIFHRFLLKRNLQWLNNTISRKILLLYHYIKQRGEYKRLFSIVDKYVLLSENFRNELYTIYPGGKKYNSKITAIPNPFFIEEVDLKTLDKKNIILYVGRLEVRQKRTDLLMLIWKELHKKLKDWDFWIVGDGPEKINMEKFCKENQLDRVKFFGFDDPVAYYKKAKILHVTSAFEGFGNVLIEAQTFGCVPVMFNSYSSAKDIITNESNGFLIKPFDINSYVEKTMQLVNSKDILEKLSIAALDNAKRYDINLVVQNWYDLFEQIQVRRHG